MWVIESILEPAGELSELVQEGCYWRSEAECRVAVARLQRKMEATAVLEVWCGQAEGLDYGDASQREERKLWAW